MSDRSPTQQTKNFSLRKAIEHENTPPTSAMTLPATAITQAEPKPVYQSTTQAKLSILLIDDESGIRLLLNRALSTQGYSVHEARNGILGLEQRQAQRPDLILLDITMPGMDGFAVLKEIRRQDPVVGVLMVSALSPERFAAEAMIEGADGYSTKPFKLQNILKEVERIGAIVQLRRQSITRQRQVTKTNHRLRRIITRQMAPTIPHEIADAQKDVFTSGVYQTATVLFLDFCHHAPQSQQRNPEEVVHLLNQHLKIASSAIMDNGGYLDKFTGDGFMAIFEGEQLPDHATFAVRAATQIQRRLRQLTRYQSSPLQMRIGLHSGEVILGNIGTNQWMSYTAIGETVNLAKQIGELAALDTILLSLETQNLLNSQILAAAQIQTKSWGNASFTWRQRITEIYQVLSQS